VETVDTSHDIHRPAVAIEKLLTTSKGGVSYEAPRSRKGRTRWGCRDVGAEIIVDSAHL